MVEVDKLTTGQKVYYQPEHYKAENKFENGLVKSISKLGGVFVVYNCDNDWYNFENYTAANTNPEDLYIGWK